MILIEALAIQCGDFALKDINLSVPTGGYAVLMGKTGSGKTTIIEAICGLRRIQSGCIRINGRDVTTARPSERDVGYVPQDGALFPTHRVFDNMAFALKLRRWSTTSIEERVQDLAAFMNITDLLDRYPENLSGGEKQRVALGRALAAYPTVLCLDEPVSALDEETRETMMVLLKAVHEQGCTILHVTHSQEEAKRLGQEVWRINRNGRLHKVDE